MPKGRTPWTQEDYDNYNLKLFLDVIIEASPTPEEKKAMFKENTRRSKQYRKNMTFEEWEKYWEYHKKYNKQRLANETPEQRETRLKKGREYWHKKGKYRK